MSVSSTRADGYVLNCKYSILGVSETARISSGAAPNMQQRLGCIAWPMHSRQLAKPTRTSFTPSVLTMPFLFNDSHPLSSLQRFDEFVCAGKSLEY